MPLTILSVAYPFAPVGPDAVGGAEQILSALDVALVRAGHRSIVLAAEGSKVAGEFRAMAAPRGMIDEQTRAKSWEACHHAIAALQVREKPDLIHLHGIDFGHYAPHRGATLVTLHLPLDWYETTALRATRSDLWLHGVSLHQQARAPAGANLLAPIANGVDTSALKPGGAKRNYALFLGRICPEKGVHLAIEAAQRAGVSLIIGGQVFAYEAHQRYFDEQLAPRLGLGVRFAGPLNLTRKRRLLGGAQCLLIPSLAEETSSLVAMEALACGTPVVAFRRGALPEIVDHGRTGFVVDGVEDMAAAIPACRGIDPRVCREEAVRRFSLDAMIASYFALYQNLTARARAA